MNPSSLRIALRFLLIGGACFAVESWLSGGARVGGEPARHAASGVRAGESGAVELGAVDALGDADRTIVVSAADVALLRDSWRRREGRLPTAAEEEAIERQAVDEEILHREALRLVAGRGAAPVRRRLVQLARALELAPLEDEPALADAAARLGFAGSDPVIRRHLIEIMRLALAAPTPAERADAQDEQVSAFVAERAERFREPERVRLTHVYLSRDRRSDVEGDGTQLLDRLVAEAVAPSDGPGLGDPFVRGASLDLSEEALDRAFGPGFASSLRELPLGCWSGPVASAYGLHVVWVHDRVAARPPALATVRGRALHAMLADGAEARLRERLDRLRHSYRVEIRGADERRG